MLTLEDRDTFLSLLDKKKENLIERISNLRAAKMKVASRITKGRIDNCIERLESQLLKLKKYEGELL